MQAFLLSILFFELDIFIIALTARIVNQNRLFIIDYYYLLDLVNLNSQMLIQNSIFYYIIFFCVQLRDL